MDDVRFHTGYNIDPVVSSEMGLVRAIERYYGGSLGHAPAGGRRAGGGNRAAQLPGARGTEQPTGWRRPSSTRPPMRPWTSRTSRRNWARPRPSTRTWRMRKTSMPWPWPRAAKRPPVVRLVNMVLIDAIRKGASDIHIEPYEKTYRIRFRIDGLLQEVMRPSIKLKDPVTSRVKILAKLNIAEKRLPQDGRIKLRVNLSGKQKVIDYPGEHPAHPVRREDRAPAAGLGPADAGPDQAGLRAREPPAVGPADLQAVRDGAGDRPHRLGQDQHPVLVHLQAEPGGRETSSPPRIRSSSTSPGSTRCR